MRPLARLTLLFVAAVGAGLPTAEADAAAPAALRWDDAFSTRAAPPRVHVRAIYGDGTGRSHDLSLWRDGNQRLRRDTDEAMSLFVDRAAGGEGEYVYRVLDRRAKTLFTVSRTSLHHIGVFTDWASLASSLGRPAGSFRLTASPRGVVETKLGACRTYRVEQPGAVARDVCWSASWGIPLFIEHEDSPGIVKRELTIIEAKGEAPATVFEPPAEGYATFDADPDVRGDD